jgi:serine/threonine-protein kinase HipA
MKRTIASMGRGNSGKSTKIKMLPAILNANGYHQVPGMLRIYGGPAYNLINTRILVDATDFALSKGLFIDDFKSPTYDNSFHPGKADFIDLGRRIGIDADRAEKLLIPYLIKQAKVEEFTNQSFLPVEVQRGLLLNYSTRRNRLNS